MGDIYIYYISDAFLDLIIIDKHMRRSIQISIHVDVYIEYEQLTNVIKLQPAKLVSSTN